MNVKAITIRLLDGNNSTCEHCSKATSQAYLIQKGNFRIRVGSSCIKPYINLKDEAIHWIRNELKEITAMQNQADAIEKAFYSKDEARLEEAMNGLAWQLTDEIVLNAASTWIEILDFRINKRLKRVDAIF